MEIRQILNIIQTDIVDLIHNQAIHSSLVNALDANKHNPFEQDEIYKDVFGDYPSQGIAKDVSGTRIRIRVAHQTGKNLSDISGADLVYEVEDLKFIIVQYKKSSSLSHNIDIDQLDKLLRACPHICSFKKYKNRKFQENRIHGFCGVYYKLISGRSEVYLHACEVNKMVIGKTLKLDNAINGLSKQTFEELFATCKIGAPISNVEIMTRQSNVLVQKDLVVHVAQENSFRRDL